MQKETWKTQTFWSLPVYTGDVSGVSSALYELGGMVVMHDPSGCNSTFNTHDEIRWTQRESLIFLSGLTQMDAICGNDRRLIGDIVSAANEFHPSFIAIASSPVPWLIGTDLAAVCAQVTKECGVGAFYVETNAMHDYTKGAGQAFLNLAKFLFSDSGNGAGRMKQGQGDREDRNRIRLNVLGATPLDFTVPGQIRSLRNLLREEGFDVVSVWALGDTLENLRHAPDADVNLVISSVGSAAALWMEERFGIPSVTGLPAGEMREIVCRALREAAKTKKSSVPYVQILQDHAFGKTGRTKSDPVEEPGCPAADTDTGAVHAERCFAGEPVTMGSFAAQLVLRDLEPCDLVPLTETVKGLIPEGTRCPEGEAQIREALGSYAQVSADPLLQKACSANCAFTPLPHFALSGRMYLDRIKPYF